MDNGKVLEFAQKNGFATVNYLGKYRGYDLYKPLYEEDVATGLPAYIIIKKNKPELVMGKEGLEIQKYRVKHNE